MRITSAQFRDFPEKTTQTESNENRNYHPYLGKRNNNIIYFYEATTTSMFNFTKTPMKSEQDRSKKYSFFILISVFNT
jgi:hypothetical protein